MDVLSDNSEMLCHLINVTKTPTHIKCGIAAFRGGLTEVKLSYKGGFVKIKLPPEVQKSATWEIYLDPNDSLEFEIIE